MPHAKRIAAAALAAIWLCAPTFAADVPSASALSAKAKEISKRYTQDIRSVVIEMYVKQPGATYTVTIRRRGNQIRKESSFAGFDETIKPLGAGFQTVVLLDGAKAWIIDPIRGKLPADPLDSGGYPADFFGWELVTPDAKVLGVEKIVDRDCVVFEPGPSAPPVLYKRVWLDASSLVLVKAEWAEVGPDGPAPVVLSNSAFSKIAGDWQMPYETRVSKSGALLYISAVKQIGVNVSVRDDLFDPDKAAAALPADEALKHLKEKN